METFFTLFQNSALKCENVKKSVKALMEKGQRTFLDIAWIYVYMWEVFCAHFSWFKWHVMLNTEAQRKKKKMKWCFYIHCEVISCAVTPCCNEQNSYLSAQFLLPRFRSVIASESTILFCCNVSMSNTLYKFMESFITEDKHHLQ